MRFAEFPDANLVGARLLESQGVSEELLQATGGPGALRRAIPYVAAGVLVVAAASLAFFLLPTEEVLTAVGGGESTAEVAEPSELARTIRETEFPGWSLVGVDTADQQLIVQVYRGDLDQHTHLPTLGAICSSIAMSEAPSGAGKITALNSHGAQGWGYEAAEECAGLAKTPAKLMRLAIIGGSQSFTRETPEERSRPGKD